MNRPNLDQIKQVLSVKPLRPSLDFLFWILSITLIVSITVCFIWHMPDVALMITLGAMVLITWLDRWNSKLKWQNRRATLLYNIFLAANSPTDISITVLDDDLTRFLITKYANEEYLYLTIRAKRVMYQMEITEGEMTALEALTSKLREEEYNAFLAAHPGWPADVPTTTVVEQASPVV